MTDPKVDLPTMDDFEESSLLDALIIEEPEKKPKANEPDPDPDPDPDPKPDPEPDPEPDPDPDPDPEKDPKAKKKNDDDPDPDPEPETDTFWSDVEKLTGRAVEAEYGETDPESPEGAAIREEALVQGAINDHLDYLSKIFPREFKALEHAANGGSIDDLYSPSEPDFTKIQMPEEDEDYQKSFMVNYYQRKGFSQTRANRLANADADSEEGLFKVSKDALTELSAVQEKEQKATMEEQKRTNQQQKSQDMQMIGSVEKIVQAGKLNNFTVPTKEREAFYQHALQHMQRNPSGGYMFVTPVDPATMEEQLQDMFFAFKKGDLSKIVQRQAKTENAKRLRRNISGGTKKSSTGGTDDKGRRGLPTMDDYTE